MEVIDFSKLPLKADSNADCRSELRDLRWENDFVCRACNHKRAYWIRTRKLYECANKLCKKQTSPTAGTQFHGAKKLQQIWLLLKAKLEEKGRLAIKTIRSITGLNHVTARRVRNRIEHSPNNPNMMKRIAPQRPRATQSDDTLTSKLHLFPKQTSRPRHCGKDPASCVILTFQERPSSWLHPIVRMLR